MKQPTGIVFGPFICNEFGDRYLYPVNRDCFRRTGSHSLYKKHFGDGLFRENSLHILIGSDSGLLLNYLRKQGLPEGSRYVLVELPMVLNRLQREGLLDPLPERMACVAPDRMAEVAETFQFRNYLYTGKINIWKSLSAHDAFLPEYAELYWSTCDFVETIAWQIRAQLGTQEFIRRHLENLPDNRTPAICLKNLFPGKTAVLLAGGPSLDDILPWVQANRDKLVVLAISRIARRLKEVGLAPDIFFSVDPQIASFDISKEMLEFWDKSLFVNMYHVAPPLLSQWQGRSLFLGPRYPWQEDLQKFMYAPGPTVSNTALGTAFQMGFSQIVLAGIDLCFSPEGLSHARGSYERQAGPQYAQFDTKVETNSGGQSFTYRAMAETIPFLAAQAAEATGSGCRIINPAPHAAKIPQVEFRHLDEIVIPPLDEPAMSTLLRTLPTEDSQNRLAYYREVREQLRQAEKAFCSIRKLGLEGLKCNDGLFGRNGMQADFRHKIRMDKVEKKLTAPALSPFARLAKTFGLPHFIKLARPDHDQEWSDAQVEEAGLIYYRAYRDSAEQLLALVREAQERIDLRLAEEKTEIDLEGLMEGWRHFAQPGRLLIWQRQRNLQPEDLDPGRQARMEEMKQHFLDNLNRAETKHLEGLKQSANPDMARQRARIMFKNKDRASLQGMLAGLEAIVEADVVAIRHLTAGYLAELDGDQALALQEYQQVLENGRDRILEDALQRIASISLAERDHDNALLALHCLTGHSPAYLPQYADLAHLLGQTRTALDAYADYLERFPEDPVVLFKVGKIYEQLGHWESAATIFRHILQQDPDNTAARISLETASRQLTT